MQQCVHPLSPSDRVNTHPKDFDIMTIAVTAASGKLGSEIVRAIQRRSPEEHPIGLARTVERASGLGIEVRPGDYDDRSQLEASLVGVDTLLLVSGMAPPDERIHQHRNVLSAASAAGVRRVIYTSVQGAEQDTAFSPIVQSNRSTEQDVRDSGLDWVIGRNGIYIEPDIDYVDTYIASGEIANSAAGGRCGYTTYRDLADAYAALLTDERHNGATYNLHGEAITQTQLAAYFSQTFGADITYRSMSVADYRTERVAELGEFIGTVIGGIYEGIRNGAMDNSSDYAAAAGRPHRTWPEYFESLRN